MNVALAGLGNMGVPVAERVLAAGHALTVYNRSPGKADGLVGQGALVAASPGALLAEAGACITVVADDRALEAVTLGEHGLLAGARAGTVLIDLSTVSVEASSRVAARAAEAGVGYLRAPVSGNPAVVRAGTLTIVVSGPRDPFERSEPLLREIGPSIHYVGEAEEARVVKLALRVMIGGTAELISEALLLGEAGGVDRATLLEVMAGSAAGSPFVRYKSGPLLADDYSATFTTAMMRKDVDLVLDLARQNGVQLPLTSQLDELLRETAEAGYAEADFMALFLRLREQAGLADTGSADARAR